MQMTKHGRPWLFLLMAAVALIALVAVACGDDDDDDDGGDSTPETQTQQTGGETPTQGASDGGDGEIDYGGLSGEIRIDGSSTVFPIASAAAEDFRGVSDVRVNVAFSGTGGGFEKFCRGETQISDASRPIKDSEKEECEANGINPVEFQVAIDALTVVVNADNDWAQCMTVEELHMAFVDGGATKWSDIRPEWPDEDIIFYYPGADSGTFDYFNEVIIEGVADDAVHRSDGTASEDDNVLSSGVIGDKNAIGYFGFAYFQEAGDQLKAVQVDDGNGCVEPTLENAFEGKYTPLSRPLFMYSGDKILSERPEVVGFMHFVLSNSGDLATSVGYIPMPEDQVEAQLAQLEPYIN